MTLRNTILLFFLLPGLMSLQAQEIDFEKVKDSFNFGRFRTIQFQGHTGGHLYSGNSLQEKVVSGYGSLTFKFGWQSRDPEIWGKYGYPTYGFGFYAGFVGDPQIFGNPNAIYSWIRFPISKPNRRNEFAITP